MKISATGCLCLSLLLLSGCSTDYDSSWSADDTFYNDRFNKGSDRLKENPYRPIANRGTSSGSNAANATMATRQPTYRGGTDAPVSRYSSYVGNSGNSGNKTTTVTRRLVRNGTSIPLSTHTFDGLGRNSGSIVHRTVRGGGSAHPGHSGHSGHPHNTTSSWASITPTATPTPSITVKSESSPASLSGTSGTGRLGGLFGKREASTSSAASATSASHSHSHSHSSPTSTLPAWRAIPMYAVEGDFNRPESAQPFNGQMIISNMAFNDRSSGPWANDNDGFITLASPTGPITSLRWIIGDNEVPLHSPKGMTTLGNNLWIADNTRLLRTSLSGTSADLPIEYVLTELNPARLNDIVADGTSLFVSDSGKDLVYRIDLSFGADNPTYTKLLGPPSVNGLAARGGRVFATSMSTGDIYEINLNGGPATPFGFASSFNGCDGLDILPDGAFVISDLKGDKVSVVNPDKSITTIIELDAPGDIAFDTATNHLYVPQIHDHRINVYELRK